MSSSYNIISNPISVFQLIDFFDNPDAIKKQNEKHREGVHDAFHIIMLKHVTFGIIDCPLRGGELKDNRDDSRSIIIIVQPVGTVGGPN